MKFCTALLSIVVACQAVSFFELVVEEWETYKVSEFYLNFFFGGGGGVGGCDSVSFIDMSDVRNKLRWLSGTVPFVLLFTRG
jgi:hypothetical protein